MINFGNSPSALSTNKSLLALCTHDWSYYIICNHRNRSDECGKCVKWGKWVGWGRWDGWGRWSECGGYGWNALLGPFLLMLSIFFNTLKDIVNTLIASLRACYFKDSKRFIII